MCHIYEKSNDKKTKSISTEALALQTPLTARTKTATQLKADFSAGPQKAKAFTMLIN